MNVTKTAPLYYEELTGDLWGQWLVELAKDIAAVDILDYIEGRGIQVEYE